MILLTSVFLAIPILGFGGNGGAAGVDPLGITGGDPGQLGQSGGGTGSQNVNGRGWTWNGTAWGKWTFVNGQYGFFSPASQSIVQPGSASAQGVPLQVVLPSSTPLNPATPVTASAVGLPPPNGTSTTGLSTAQQGQLQAATASGSISPQQAATMQSAASSMTPAQIAAAQSQLQPGAKARKLK